MPRIIRILGFLIALFALALPFLGHQVLGPAPVATAAAGLEPSDG